MKKIIIYLLLVQCLYSVAQVGEILPLSLRTTETPNGTYFQDEEFLFQPFIGTWQGTFDTGVNAKLFRLTLSKVNHHLNSYPDGSYFYEDILIGKYIVTNIATGEIIENTTTELNPDNAELNSMLPHDNKLNFNFTDIDRCYNSGTVYLIINPTNSNELQYHFVLDDFWINTGCTYLSKYDIPIPIPDELMTLVKVN